jgi:phospholipid/cholesterol/gamma-HCH transport system substrate-binding protein
MDGKREQAFVGLFVIVAAGLLLASVFAMSGAFSRSAPTYRAKFSAVGGLEEGAPVRYSAGPKVGRVKTVKIDPQDPTLLDVTFSVQSGVPIKTDSHVKIESLSPLGDNHLDIVPGSSGAAAAPPGSLIASDPYIDFNALTAKLDAIAPDAQRLLQTLNDRATELKVTIARVNDVLNDQNRANLSGTLAGANGLIADNRKQIKATIASLNAASQRLGPLLENLQNTSTEANKTIGHVDTLIQTERPEIHQAILQLRQSLATLNKVAENLNYTLDVNSENINDTLDNIRQLTENLNDFSDTIKDRPSSIIRSVSPRDHKPGDPK